MIDIITGTTTITIAPIVFVYFVLRVSTDRPSQNNNNNNTSLAFAIVWNFRTLIDYINVLGKQRYVQIASIDSMRAVRQPYQFSVSTVCTNTECSVAICMHSQ